MSRLLWVLPSQGQQSTGKERLVESLLKAAPPSVLERSILLTPVPYSVRGAENWHLSKPGNYAWNDLALQRRADRSPKGDIVVLPFGTLAWPYRGRKVVGLVLDDFYGPRNLGATVNASMGALYRRVSVPAFARRADAAWITDAGLRDRMTFGSPPKTLSPGVDLDVFTPDASQTIAQPGSFLLTIGGTGRRKNAGAQAAALVEVGRSLGLKALGVGFFAAAASGIERLGRVSDGELSALFRDAAGVLLAPRAEGWGLPVLEALSVGARVAASRTPSLRDLQRRLQGSELAHLQTVDDPSDVRHMASVLSRLVTCPRPTDACLVALRAVLDSGARTRQFWADFEAVVA